MARDAVRVARDARIAGRKAAKLAAEARQAAALAASQVATGREPTTDGPIGRQQEVLAVDDLVSFAIHARRLIGNTASPKRFTGVALELYHKPSETIAITRVINKLVHHRDIEIVRNVFKLGCSQQKTRSRC